MKRIFLIFLTTIMILSMIVTLSLTGCKTATTAATTAAETTAAATTAAETTAAPETTAAETKQDFTGVTLEFWPVVNIDNSYKALYDRFQKDTGIKLNMTPWPNEEVFLNKWASGQRPDIADWHANGNWWVQINAPETCQDLTNLPFVTNYKPAYDGINKIQFPDGKIYGCNIAAPHVFGVCYNKEIFQKLNLQIPKNFDEFYKLCETIKKAGYTPLYIATADQWQCQLMAILLMVDYYKADPISFFNDINTGKTNFVQPAFVDSFKRVKTLIDAGFYQKNSNIGTFVESQTALYNGDVAMVDSLEIMIKILVDNYGADNVTQKIGMFGLSLNDNTVPSGYFSPGASIIAPKTGDAKKEAAAREFINYIMGPGYPQFAKDSGMPSVVKGVDVDITIGPIKEIMSYFEKSNTSGFAQLVKASFGTYEKWMADMFVGTKTPEEVAQALSDAFAQSAKALKLPGWENK